MNQAYYFPKWYPIKQKITDKETDNKQYIISFIYISLWIKVIASHAKVEKVVNAAKNPNNRKFLIFSDIKLFSIIPIIIPNTKEPNILTAKIATGKSKKIKFFNKLFDK